MFSHHALHLFAISLFPIVANTRRNWLVNWHRTMVHRLDGRETSGDHGSMVMRLSFIYISIHILLIDPWALCKMQMCIQSTNNEAHLHTVAPSKIDHNSINGEKIEIFIEMTEEKFARKTRRQFSSSSLLRPITAKTWPNALYQCSSYVCQCLF